MKQDTNVLSRSLRQNRNLTLAVLALVLVAIAVPVVRGRQRHWMQARVAELQKLQQDRQVTAADQMVETLRHNEAGKLGQEPLASQFEKTTQWLSDEHSRLNALQELLTKLQQQAAASFKEANVESVARDWNQARRLKETVAPEFQPGFEAPLRQFETQFTPILVETQPKRQAEFQKQLEACERLAGELDRHDLMLPALRDEAKQGLTLIDQLEALANPPVDKLKIPDTLTEQIAPLKAKLTGLHSDLTAMDQADTAMRAATTFSAYLAALQVYDGGQIRHLPAIHAARAVVDAKPDENEFERLLLLPDNAPGWAAFLKHPELVTLPQDVWPAEKVKWNSLRDDENLRDIHKYVMPVGPEGLPVCYPPNHDGAAFTRGAVEGFKINSMGESGTVMFAAMTYIPSSGVTNAVFTQIYSGCAYYHGEVWGVEKLGGLSAESALWTKTRSPDLLDAKGVHYTKSVLELLDGVRGGEVSPLFKAYIQLHLLEIVAIRPTLWGSYLIPALAQEEKDLKELGVATLQSGDWMVPAQVQKFEKPLAEFYARTKGVSYVKQERFLQTLIGTVHADGLEYDGFVAADGSPVLTVPGKSHTMLWGWSLGTQTPALLFQTVPGHDDLQPVAKPMPFTPLFSCKRSLTDSLAAADRVAGIPSTNLDMRPPLPPLFQGSARP